MKIKNYIRNGLLAAVFVLLCGYAAVKAQSVASLVSGIHANPPGTVAVKKAPGPISPCPFKIINRFPCPVTVFVEFRDINCGTMCPWSGPVTIPPFGSIPAGTAACCAAGIYDMIFFLVDINGAPIGWQSVEYGTIPSCTGAPLGISGPMPAGGCPSSSVWNMVITPSAGIVTIF